MNTIIIGGGGIAKGIASVIPAEIIEEAECDVRKIDQIQRIMGELAPDVVICTAGISKTNEIIDATPQELANQIEVNLLGSFYVAKCAADLGATMIFIASVAGMHGKPEHAAYSASKSGVISLVQSLAFEGHNAYAISPGRVNTALRERDYPQDKPNTRLEPAEIGVVVEDIMNGKYESGDNIVIRRIGFETAPIMVDKGPFKEYLKVGEPVTL
jgi:NAD(P)-dependent dehydrogenase (short-subunit alcohol dehydrogenase family)